MNINKVLRSGEVRRYHTTPGVPTQSLSSHQWGVAMLLQKFYPDERKEVLEYALTHDVAELETGDMPAPTKRKYPSLREILEKIETDVEIDLGIERGLSLVEYQRVKLCDIVESMWYCHLLIRQGNRDAIYPFQNTRDYYVNMEERNELSNHLVLQMHLEVNNHAQFR